MRLRVGPVEAFWGDLGGFRPCVWIDLPHSQLVVFFGWQTPDVVWLR
jgi:hypothetical protein